MTMISGDDLYSRLGLGKDASADDIRNAYFEAARRLHPDTNPDPRSVELFLKVQEAYEILSNPDKKRLYDASSPKTEANSPAVSFNVVYSRQSLTILDEPQLVYVILDLTSIPDPGNVVTPPLNLCLVIDRSTSMQGQRMDMVKNNVHQLIQELRPQDIISIVSYSDRAEVLLTPTRISDMGKTSSRVNKIQTSGSTEIYYGLEAGLAQLRANINSGYISHLILLTDGRTYGDEEACLKLAEQAASDGISISGLGIGADWNDKFLDQIASYSGGSTAYITGTHDLKNYLSQKLQMLGKVYAENILLDFASDPGCKLTYVFRIQPEATPLCAQTPICVGNVAQFQSMRVLLEFQVDPITKPVEEIALAKGFIRMDIPTWTVPSTWLRLNLALPVSEDIDLQPPPQAIMQCLSRLMLYRMQEKAREEVEKGDIAKATRHLHYLATHLLSQGERELAQAVLLEADAVNNDQKYSKEGDKRIKYGTRALLLLPGQEYAEQ